MIPDWLQRHAWWLLTLSVALGLAAALVAGRFLVALPADYFLQDRQPAGLGLRPSWSRRALFISKNLAGIGLIACGAVMSLPLVPGPGLVVLLIGLSLTNFPGKRKWELRLLRSRVVLPPLNWLRGRAGRPALELPAMPSRPFTS